MPKSRREIIFAAVTDLVSDFLYYDRKEDEDLPRDAIEEALEKGEITVEEILDHFAAELCDGLGIDGE